MVIDFHAHLCDIDGEPAPWVLNTGYSNECNRRIPDRGPRALGIAPQFASSWQKEWLVYIEARKPWAIGEIGLDGKYWNPSQLDLLEAQLEIARGLEKPIVVHSRMAEQRLFDLLRRDNWDLPVVFHFFSGPEELAFRITRELDGYISFPPRFSSVRKRLAKALPLDRMVVESDCPYVGKVPDETSQVISVIARWRSLSSSEVEERLRQTWLRLFGKDF